MDTKSIFLSKTFWGVALTALAPLAPKVGLHINTSSAGDIASQIVAILGAAMAIYGRVHAQSKVSLTGQ